MFRYVPVTTLVSMFSYDTVTILLSMFRYVPVTTLFSMFSYVRRYHLPQHVQEYHRSQPFSPLSCYLLSDC